MVKGTNRERAFLFIIIGCCIAQYLANKLFDIPAVWDWATFG